MAATLQNSAAGTVNRGQPCSYYGKDMKTNPVFQALEQEMKQYVGYMKKRSAPGFKKPTEEPSSRAADALFELWNKYEPRLPMDYYQEKLLEMGDFLVSIKEYKLALWQCYGRYLENFGDVNVEQITDVETFKSVFFPDGFDAANAGLTFRALMGKAICMYQVVKLTDPKLQNPESVDNCTQLLSFLRLVTQVVLPKEPLCWLVYNGTIHIYSVSRHLMSLGYSAKVLEYLLWACMCMEGSVPLLSVRYLPWRSTLYTAVCQCYYDCKAAPHAEAFARRAISKVNELSQLEHMSSAKESKQTESTFKQATTKLGIMVFKRSAFETRKRPKGLLRPKTRANLKDAQTLPWPRTPTERLLADMFEGSAAQFMCIIETLTDSNRRTLLTAPPAPDSEVEMLDVYAELFMAAQEIIAGGGGNALQSPANPTMIRVPGMAGVVTNNALIDMVGSGEDGVPLSGVIKLVKLAYCYEQWDLFDLLTENVQAYLKEINDANYKYDEKAIEILKAMENASSSRKVKRQPSMHFSEDESAMLGQEPTLPPPPTTAPTASARPGGLQHDELIQVADVLLSVIAGSFSPEKMDLDMIVDAALFLWNKCKSVFQKYQTGSTENAKYLQKMENASKWVYILDIVHQVLGWCGMSSVDPTLTAEVVVRLALVMEASATLDATEGKDKKMTKSKSVITSAGRTREDEDGVTVVSGVTRDLRKSEASPSRGEQSVSAPILKAGARQQLLAAREILELGLSNVSFARQAVALTDGKSIADIGWVKELNEDLFAPMTWKEIEEGPTLEEFDPNKSRDANSVMNAIRDLHLELIFMHHRVSLKLAAMGPDPALKAPKPFKRRTCSKIPGSRESMRPVAEYIEDFDELISMCNKNQLSKALLYMQRAWMASSDDQPTAEQKDLLQNSVNLITQAQTEEKKMYVENAINGKALSVKKSKVPPPPILLCRTDATMVFQPAPFEPPNGQKVAWYRLFGRSATGSNVKVRLNDYFLPGTGEEVPSFHCELRVSGLTPNERYVFAVAAYTADGKLIGGSVGETGKPILAAHPLPVLMTWGFLSQVAYQCGCYDIARQACEVLWGHFVAEPPPPESVTYTTSAQKDFQLSLHRLNRRVVSQASPVLLRQFLSSIFINVDISVKNLFLFCDVICDKGPLYKGQINRLKECERMLVALELAGWLNEANLALQAVIQCYGLLAPLIFYKIPSVSVVQILERCLSVLQEIPSGLRQRRTEKINESLHHMTACLSYHMARVLRTWGQRNLANCVNEAGRKLLALEDPTKQDPAANNSNGIPLDTQEEEGVLTLAALKKKKTKKGPLGVPDAEGPVNEELKALEAHMLKLSKQAQGEHELTGNEDPSILHAYIAYLPSRIAYREVSKFKRRTRYLEFFVQVVQKALTEGIAEMAIEWCEDALQWIQK
ncbi:cilia- and flagella-associated protein 54-like [Lingula anatina]|uniref:Cilia- and flagella-associated protein 54-like n=1 Tax=Lingula anatina TaxID=7574 RepID=A0A2R2MIT1_LINAN|nr:cilia- and flagella-associated protein 54-like [Lingula anatina]|eukprot:XP_023930113.1 cilia- and flagella-associated protein 54-like [Lingula anatina]